MNFVLILITVILSACHHSDHKSSVTKYKELTSSNKNTVEVIKLVKPENYIWWETKSNQGFHVKKAWNDLKENSCKECHQGHSLNEIKGKDFKRSHWNIKIKHASAKVMACKTCHDSTSVWKLKLGDTNISVNYAPQLCIQCHSKQGKDWERGSHGKRANGWQSQRAILNCINCHNPHKPAFNKRWPKVAPYRPLNNEVRL